MLNWILILALVVYFFYIIKKILQIIFGNGDPAKTIAWVLFIFFVPIIGVYIYHIIGVNYRKEKTFRTKYLQDLDLDRPSAADDIKVELVQGEIEECLLKNLKLINLMQRNGNSTLTYGNEVRVLQNGGPTFEAIYQAIQGAQKFVHLEYYIFLQGDVTRKLITLLQEKVRQGVAVRIIYDGVGSWSLSESLIEEIKAGGIIIYPFMPVKFGPIANRINYRNHRKIAVVDGTIGFTGGINIADKYLKGDDELGAWRDTHLEVIGPAAAHLDRIFRQDWYFVSNEVIESDEYPGVPESPGASPVQIVASGPDSDYANIRHEYFALINEAEEYIYITTPYFIPGSPIIEALKIAALSGVEVILLLPRNSDSKILKWSIRSYLADLLKVGVRIFLYQNGFLHSKTVVSDDNVASIGTANVDQRSFDQNFEVNALVYDPTICQELKTQFFQDLIQSQELSLDLFSQRPLSEKLLESTARLLSPLL